VSVGDEDAPHVVRGPPRGGEPRDQERFRLRICPSWIDEGYAVIASDGVCIDLFEVSHRKWQRDAPDARRDAFDRRLNHGRAISFTRHE